MATIEPHPCHAAIAARRERVVELTRQGHSASQIAAFLHVSKRSVQRIRTEMGVAQPQHGPAMTEDELRTAAELINDGCSYSEVARTLGRNPHTIRRHFPGQGWSVGEGARMACFNRWAKERAQKVGIEL